MNGVAERGLLPAAVQQFDEPVLVQVARASDLLVVGARSLPARYLLRKFPHIQIADLLLLNQTF